MPVRLTAFVACLLLAFPASAARQQLDTLTPAQAISRATAAAPKPVRALFQFKVQSAAKSRDGFYLDSEKNFRSPQNLGVAIKASAHARADQQIWRGPESCARRQDGEDHRPGPASVRRQ